MKIKNILFVLAFIVGASSLSQAQKIALVDINEVLSSMPDYQNAQKELDRVAAEWRQEISQEFDKIKSMYNKFQAEQVLLSSDDKAKKEDEIVKKKQK